jgi:isopentenyl-diphosphate delta-isomerase
MKMTNDMHTVVSSEAEELILVDVDDNATGYLSKAECHNGAGVLHRAFSVFLFDAQGKVLLQRRAASKRLWGGYWSNSCCSHPRRGESMEIATRRRLQDELNVGASLEFVYKFIYTAAFGDTGSENELCHVYLGRLLGEIEPNNHEIAATRFLSGAELGFELESSPEAFTPWLQLEWKALVGEYAGALNRYADLPTKR